jgi:hypothetical protein
MGAGIAASPHCAERRICRCSLAVVSPREGFDPASRSWLTSSGVAFHPAAPSCEEPGPSTRLRRPKARWSFDLPGLAPEPRSEDRKSGPKPPDVPRPFLGRPLLRPALPFRTEMLPDRVALEEDRLFRRLFPTGSDKNPKALPNACRRRSVLRSPAAPSCRFRPSGEAGTSVPIT